MKQARGTSPGLPQEGEWADLNPDSKAASPNLTLPCTTIVSIQLLEEPLHPTGLHCTAVPTPLKLPYCHVPYCSFEAKVPRRHSSEEAHPLT